MKLLFFIAAVVAVVSAGMAITRKQPVHALLYLVVLLLAISAIFFLMGALLAAVLEVIVYAGAVMVLFLFVVMMLNQGERTEEREKMLLEPGIWIGPVLLTLVLFIEWLYIIFSRADQVIGFQEAAGAVFSKGFPVTIKQIGIALFGTYGLGVELASMLLLSALVGSLVLSNRRTKK